jgi:hypothetical protein
MWDSTRALRTVCCSWAVNPWFKVVEGTRMSGIETLILMLYFVI